MEELAAGWELWNRDTETLVLAYRPDVFDAEGFPAPCLPTIYVTHGSRNRRPGRRQPGPETPWYVTLFLEPEVSCERSQHENREAALDGARTLAEAFATGSVDYRDAYQVPREAYLDRLDELTGQG